MTAIARAIGLVALAGGLLFAPPFRVASAADEASPCRPQIDLTRFRDRLVRTGQRLAKHEPLTIVALGSSSTAGAGASSPATCYPSRLEARLHELLPGAPIRVINHGVNGEDVQEMLARFEESVIAEKPDLVLWQTGTNALLRGNSLADVRTMVAEGVARLRRLKIDVVLIDPQFAPSVIANPHAHDMVDLLAGMAKEGRVDFFPRFAVMQNWHEVDKIPFETFVSPDGLHMNDWGYACFGRLLADAIVEAATRPATMAAVPDTGTLAHPRP